MDERAIWNEAGDGNLLPARQWPAEETLDKALAYTHKDVFPHIDGYVTFAPHWHFAFTEQAVSNGATLIPSFKPTLESMGVDAAMIMDFHIDGHPADLTDLRLKEIDAYYKACRRQSDKRFLLIPAEEADVFLGGALVAYVHQAGLLDDGQKG